MLGPKTLTFVALSAVGLIGCGSSGTNNVANPPPNTAGTAGSGAGGASSGAGGQGGGTSGSSTAGGKPGAGGGGGSNSAVGGSTDPGPVDHTFGKCDALPKVGVWENITPKIMGPEPLAVFAAVSPTNSAVVYTSIGSIEGERSFFRSDDCGATWQAVAKGKNAQAISSGFQWSMAVDPGNGDIIYAINGYGGPPSLLKSVNGGVDWELMIKDGTDAAKAVASGFLQGVAMNPDPDFSKHLLLTYHDNCVGDFAPMCMAESKNGGNDWRVFKGPTGGWEEGANPIIIDDKTIMYAAPFNGLYWSGDNGGKWEKVSEGGYGQIYKTADGRMYLGSNSGVQTSMDGHTWTMIPNSPKSSGIIGDGERIFTCFQNDTSGSPFYSAPEADPTTWTKMTEVTMAQGAPFLTYDSDHHIMFAGAYKGGLWRVVTK